MPLKFYLNKKSVFLSDKFLSYIFISHIHVHSFFVIFITYSVILMQTTDLKITTVVYLTVAKTCLSIVIKRKNPVHLFIFNPGACQVCVEYVAYPDRLNKHLF